MLQCITIQSVSSPVMMAMLGLGLKPGDVITMELGVEKILLAKVGITSLQVKTLLMKILCPYT